MIAQLNSQAYDLCELMQVALSSWFESSSV